MKTLKTIAVAILLTSSVAAHSATTYELTGTVTHSSATGEALDTGDIFKTNVIAEMVSANEFTIAFKLNDNEYSGWGINTSTGAQANLGSATGYLNLLVDKKLQDWTATNGVLWVVDFSDRIASNFLSEVHIKSVTVPEPNGFLMFGLGLVGLSFATRKRQKIA